MNPNSLLAKLLSMLGIFQLHATDPEGGSADRGDNFVPTTDEDDKSGAKTEVDETKTDKVDDETEETPEEKAEREAAEAKAKAKGNARIPLARHEQILAKEREQRAQVEAQLAAARGATQIANTNEQLTKLETKVVDLEAAYTKALVDGETKEAARLMAEIRVAERTINNTRVQFETQAAEARAYERARYDATVDRLEAAYPALDQNHADFDEEVSDQVTAMMQGFVARGGITRADALQKAVKALLKPVTKTQEKAVDTKARPDADEVARKLAEDRKAAAVKRNVADAERTPPSTARVGQDSDKLGGKLDAKAVIRMSQEEFAKLDDATLAKMRGDEFV